MRLLNQHHLAWMAALGLVTGCNTPTAASHPQAAAAPASAPAGDDEGEAGLRDHHRHQHRGGVVQFIAMGLDTLGPNDAARPQVEKVQRDLYACMAPAGEIQQRLHLAIADGVAAGAVDLVKVDAIIGQLDRAVAGVHDCSTSALNQLHDLLSPAERAELVEKVQAHWEVWRQVNAEEGSAGHGTGGRLSALTREVSLTPDQVERAAAALHTALPPQVAHFDRPAVDSDVQAFAASFEAATFDARSATPHTNPRVASHGATRMALFYGTVTPLLTPAQRATLAGHLRVHAAQHPIVSSN